MREPVGINRVAHVFLSCEWHSICSVIFHVQFLICLFVCLVTGNALRNPQLPIFRLISLPLCRRCIDWPQIETRQTVTVCIQIWLLRISHRKFCSARQYPHIYGYKIQCYRKVSNQQKHFFFLWKPLVSFGQVPITWWRMSILVFNHKTSQSQVFFSQLALCHT